MAAKPRRRYSHAQARNIMKRAIDEIVDPGPTSIDPLWEWFESLCAYCGVALARGDRDAHTDHAERDGGNHIGNLVLACGRCNGDEKRDMDWRTFLELKAPDPATFALRERRILDWMAANPKLEREYSPEVADLRQQAEALVEEFRLACVALQDAVKRPGQAAVTRQMTRSEQAWPTGSAELAVVEARRATRASWVNLQKGARSLLGLEHEPFGTPHVMASARSQVNRIARDTGLQLPELLELFDRLGPTVGQHPLE
jgi:hypothetical protein